MRPVAGFAMAVALAAAASVTAAAHAAPSIRAAAAPIPQPTGCQLATTLPLPGSGAVRRVPEQYPTIQAAVDAADEGDTVLIAPGEYSESVRVDEEHLRIRGMDRERVILDGRRGKAGTGKHRYRPVGLHVVADGVVIENLTLRYFRDAPIDVDNVTGYWIRYVTTYRNRFHNVARESRCGQVDHLYSSGHGAAALALLGCNPCDFTVADTVLTRSAYGFVAEDALKGVRVGAMDHGNHVVLNHHGILAAYTEPTEDVDADRFKARITIAHNLVEDNDAMYEAVAGALPSDDFIGWGIVVASDHTHVHDNTVIGHDQRQGILVGAAGAATGVPASAVAFNRIEDNVVGCGVGVSCYPEDRTPQRRLYGADLALDASGPGTCFSGNTLPGGGEPTTLPPSLQDGWSCKNPITPPGFLATIIWTGALRDNERCEQGCSPTWDQSRPIELSNGRTVENPIPRAPAATRSAPDDDGDGDYADDGAIDEWLPAVTPWQG